MPRILGISGDQLSKLAALFLLVLPTVSAQQDCEYFDGEANVRKHAAFAGVYFAPLLFPLVLRPDWPLGTRVALACAGAGFLVSGAVVLKITHSPQCIS